MRLVCLIYVLSLFSKNVQAGQGRIHLRGKEIDLLMMRILSKYLFSCKGSRYNEPEDVVAFESECKCNRDEVISISVSRNLAD